MLTFTSSLRPIPLEALYVDGLDNDNTALETIQMINPERPRIPARGLAWTWGLQLDEFKAALEEGGNNIKVHPSVAQLFRDETWSLMPTLEAVERVTSISEYNTSIDVHNDTRKNIFKELCHPSYEYNFIPVNGPNFPYILRNRLDDRCWTPDSPTSFLPIQASVHPSIVVTHAPFVLNRLPCAIKSLRHRYSLVEDALSFTLQIGPNKFGHLDVPTTPLAPLSISPAYSKRKREAKDSESTSLAATDDEEAVASTDTDSCSENAYKTPRPKQCVQLDQTTLRRIESWQEALNDSCFSPLQSPAKVTGGDAVWGRYAQEPCREPSEIIGEVKSLPLRWKATKSRRSVRRTGRRA